ncbi:uncharacterized protein N7498_001361 [Penicillium cinerascens]|uniref:Uncharacterized protein n=1 Tax=Penicillium cinerascens TaxID=70096 RepID=A0A9W9NG39_9EURO|nr:uncharacterized protein N7498_001361 [Penicillium cinerascens]KAJ5219262.1 hypothetical protein N7498_001361 [Penicillium cinerascens]
MDGKHFFAQRDDIAKEKRRKKLEKTGYISGAHDSFSIPSHHVTAPPIILRSANPEIQDLQIPSQTSHQIRNGKPPYPPSALHLPRPAPRTSQPAPLNSLPLHQRIRAVFRSEQEPTTSDSTALPFSLPKTDEERALRIQEADQLAQYARAQRTYSALLERYNPGMSLDEEEKVRLTARRVGMDLPELYGEEGKTGKE